MEIYRLGERRDGDRGGRLTKTETGGKRTTGEAR